MALSNIKLFEKFFLNLLNFTYFYFLHFFVMPLQQENFCVVTQSNLAFPNTHNVIFLKYLISLIF